MRDVLQGLLLALFLGVGITLELRGHLTFTLAFTLMLAFLYMQDIVGSRFSSKSEETAQKLGRVEAIAKAWRSQDPDGKHDMLARLEVALFGQSREK